MSQPVKLSDDIVGSARVESRLFARSIAGQIEHWAKLGRAIEDVLSLGQVRHLRGNDSGRTLEDSLNEVGSLTGSAKLAAVLEGRSYPHYDADPSEEGLFLRTEENGVVTRGRFHGRQFLAE